MIRAPNPTPTPRKRSHATQPPCSGTVPSSLQLPEAVRAWLSPQRAPNPWPPSPPRTRSSVRYRCRSVPHRSPRPRATSPSRHPATDSIDRPHHAAPWILPVASPTAASPRVRTVPMAASTFHAPALHYAPPASPCTFRGQWLPPPLPRASTSAASQTPPVPCTASPPVAHTRPRSKPPSARHFERAFAYRRPLQPHWPTPPETPRLVVEPS